MTPTAPKAVGRPIDFGRPTPTAPLSPEKEYEAAALAPALARGPTLGAQELASATTRLHARADSLLAQVTYPGLEWQTITEGWHVHLRVHNPEGIDNVTSEDMPWSGRWWRLSEHMTDSEIVGTAFKAIITCLEHEARENFLYKGQAVYDAHLDVEELVKLRASKGCLDTRG